MLDRLPNLALAGEPVWNGDLAAPGLRSLPVRFGPAGSHYLPGQPEFVSRVIESSLWAELFVRTQDDVIDDPAEPSHMLLLGNVGVMRWLHQLRELLPEAPAFWQIAHDAWIDFAAATAWGQIEHRGKMSPFGDAAIERLGDKFAPMEIPVAAILYQAGRIDLHPAYRRLLRDLGAATQIFNDLANYEEDLARSNFTFFLTCCSGHPEEAVAQGAAAERCLAVARRFTDRAREHLPAEAPPDLEAHLDKVNEEIRSFQVPGRAGIPRAGSPRSGRGRPRTGKPGSDCLAALCAGSGHRLCPPVQRSAADCHPAGGRHSS